MKVANKVKFEVLNLEKNVSLPETFNTILLFFFKEKQYSVYPMKNTGWSQICFKDKCINELYNIV